MSYLMVKFGHFNPPFALDVSKVWKKRSPAAAWQVHTVELQ